MASKYDRFNLVTDFEIAGDQGHAIEELVAGLNRGDKAQVLLGVTGSGKTFTMAQCIAQVNRPDPRHGPQQDARRAALPGVSPVLSRERRRVLRQLLRLLPAGSLRPDDRLVYREGSDDQRRDRPDAALGDAVAVRAARRHHRGQRLVHIRAGVARGLLRDDAAPRARAANRSRPDPEKARRDSVRAQRPRLQPRRLPRPRRHRRGLPLVRRHRAQDRVVRRRSRRADELRPAHRQGPAEARQGRRLSEDALRHVPRPHEAGRRDHQGGAHVVSGTARIGRQGPRSAPAAPADDVRSGDDQGDRLLPWHRELRQASDRAGARRAAADAPRLSAGRRAHHRRRKPPVACRRFAACTTGTARARKCSWRTGSGCRPRSTTGRSTSKSGRSGRASSCSSRRRPDLTSSVMPAARSSSRSSVRRASSIPSSKCGRCAARSTTC